MSGSGMASVGQVAAKVGSSGKGPALQHGKERPGHLFQAPLKNPRIAGSGEAVPEWKLNSLCTEYGLPPNVRGHLPMGGYF